MRNWANWTLIILGVVLAIVELLLGAATGLDLLLIGGTMVAGGSIGLFFESTKIGFFSTAALALIYFAFLRNWLRAKLTPTDQPTNVEAIIGHTGMVTARIAPHAPGQVKVGDEVWRAELAQPDGAAREAGETVTVQAVEGVTLRVR